LTGKKSGENGQVFGRYRPGRRARQNRVPKSAKRCQKVPWLVVVRGFEIGSREWEFFSGVGLWLSKVLNP
jgi:hypothetical protein